MGSSLDTILYRRSLEPSWHQVRIVLTICREPVKIIHKMERFGWKDCTKFRDKFINPLLKLDLLTMTIPDKPRSKSQ